MPELSDAERAQRAQAALRHGAHAEAKIAPAARAQKRRFLRQSGLTASQLTGLGRAYLDNYARAQAKVELMDRWIERHGFFDQEGNPPGLAKTYFTALNAARHALTKLEAYLKERPGGQDTPRVVHMVIRDGRDGQTIVEAEDPDENDRAGGSSGPA